MVFARRSRYSSRANALTGTGRFVKKSRFNASKRLTEIKSRPPTAARQRAQILTNARFIASHQRYINQHKVYCDYQLSTQLDYPAANEGWSAKALTSFVTWRPVLRRDDAAYDASSTFVKYALINMRYILKSAGSMAVSVFVVTPRKYATNVDILNMTLGEEYIENGIDEGANVRLNSNVFKVHYSKYLTLTANAYGSAPEAAENVGNPNTTWRKAQVKLPLNMKVRMPKMAAAQSPAWHDVDFADLPYYHKYYMICYWAASNVPMGEPTPEISMDCLFTTLTTD